MLWQAEMYFIEAPLPLEVRGQHNQRMFAFAAEPQLLPVHHSWRVGITAMLAN